MLQLSSTHPTLGAQPKSLRAQGAWGQNTEILLQAKGTREHELSQ